MKNKYIILISCCMSLFLVTMDVTVVNVALPTIQKNLITSTSQLQWVIDAYTLTLASFLLLSGSTADKIGRKKIFLLGLFIFGIGSFLCGIAPTINFLIFFRVIQGIGGSMLNPVAMSIITNVFTDSKERAWAIGWWGSVTGISLAVGPILGGALTHYISWRSTFYINIPFILIALLLSFKFIPESKSKYPKKNDSIGQILIIIFLFTLIYWLIEIPKVSIKSSLMIFVLSLCILSLIIFIFYEYRQKEPLVNIKYFYSIPFTSAALLAILGFTIYNGFLFINTIYLQNSRAMTSLLAGLYTLPLAISSFFTAPISGKMVGEKGTKIPIMICGFFMSLASFLYIIVSTYTNINIFFLLTIYIILGIGFGMLNAPITVTAVEGMPLSESGTAASIAVTCKQVGNSLGVALPTIFSTGTSPNSINNPHIWILYTILGLMIIFLGYFSNTKYAKKSLKKVQQLLKSSVTNFQN